MDRIEWFSVLQCVLLTGCVVLLWAIYDKVDRVLSIALRAEEADIQASIDAYDRTVEETFGASTSVTDAIRRIDAIVEEQTAKKLVEDVRARESRG